MIDETILNEKAEVLAVFYPSERELCRPVRVRFGRREIDIKEIGLAYPVRKNGEIVHVFDVTDGQADYRLEFSTKYLIWRVTREADHYEQ